MIYEQSSSATQHIDGVGRDAEAPGRVPAVKPRILLVDDEPSVSGHLAEALSDAYCVDLASSGIEALRAVMRAKPDLVVTDIVMPEMDGVELLRTLRSVPSTQSIPVLLISGRAAEEQRIDGFQKGADGYLAKPYNERELRALIGSMIQSARQRAEEIHRKTLDEAERRAMADRAALLESITDAFYALDAQYRVTYINQRALDCFGKTREEMLGRSIWEALPTLAGSLLQEQYERALRMRVPAALESKSLISGRWLDLRVFPAGNGIAVYFQDITDRKRAEQELQAALLRLESREWRLELATRVAGLGVFSWDAQSETITFENDPPKAILRLSRAGRLTAAHLLQDLVHPEDRRTLLRQVARCVRKSEPLRSLCRVRDVEGSWRWLEINAARESVRDEGPIRIVGVVEDVTERQQAQERLRDADRRKDEFLALLSHELRNPLAPIANGLATLRYRCPPDPALQQTLAIMDRQLSHLLRLVNDLLDVERITHGKLQLQLKEVLLVDVLASAVEACRPLIEKRKHELTAAVRATDVVVNADPDRLEQVITNLIHNSAKYTPPGGRIGVAIDREGESAIIIVTDNGIGISPDALEKVFEMFAKMSAQPPNLGGGLGIGLSLVRDILQMHGGTIRAQSAGAGKGSTFTVRLPLASAGVERPAAGMRERAPAPDHREGLRVLVVDDNVDATVALCDLLELKGHRTSTAVSGEEAIERARSFRPQIIFMDVGLPGIDGVEAARRIRGVPELRDVPIIALSGWSHPIDRARSVEAGMVEHLAKPIDMDALEQALARVSANTAGDQDQHRQ